VASYGAPISEVDAKAIGPRAVARLLPPARRL